MTFSPWQARAAAAGSGLLLAAAFPPLNWWPLAFVAMIPVLLAVWSGRKPRSKAVPALSSPFSDSAEDDGDQTHRQDACAPKPQEHRRPDCESEASAVALSEAADLAASAQTTPAQGRDCLATGFWKGFRLGWIFGFVFFLGTMWWVAHVSVPGMLILCAYLALYPAAAIGLAAWLGMSRAEGWLPALGKSLLIAAAWCGLEWARGIALSGFTWNLLAVPLFPMAGMRHLSAFTGVTGVSLVPALLACLAAACLRLHRGRRRRALIASGVLLLAAAGLWEFIAQFEDGMPAAKLGAPDHTALLVQPNVSMEDKMSPNLEVQRKRYLDLLELTDSALASTTGPNGLSSIDLVVWPESAIPGFFDEALAQGAFEPQLEQGLFTLVTGADSQDWDRMHNSVAALRGHVENHELHHKVRLVPFGEFIPFRKELPILETMLGGLIPFDFAPGESLEPLRPEGQPFGIVPLVCFEDTIGRHARQFIRPEPQVLVNVTNDNWFAESPATEIHFVNARWRAPELHRPLLRSANTGVTASVSPEGHVERLPSFQKGSVLATFRLTYSDVTFYARRGDIFSQVAGALSLLVCGFIWLKRISARRGLPGLS